MLSQMIVTESVTDFKRYEKKIKEITRDFVTIHSLIKNAAQNEGT